MPTEQNLTGYPSIDKPWLKYYPDSLFSLRKNQKNYSRIIDKIKATWTNPEEVIINYYDTEIKVGIFFNRVNDVAKSLVAFGIKKGDSIVASLESVPEYLELLLASELIGCSVKDFLGDTNSIIQLINADNSANCYIAPDYLSASDSNEIYNKTNIKNIITVDPLFSVDDKSKLRSNIIEVISSKYTGEETKDVRNISWGKFLDKGKNIDYFQENNENNIKLFSSFTSGSAGEPKEVIHSSKSVLGIINQMCLFPFHKKYKDTWLNTIAPPIHATVIISMMCYPLADGKTLLLDPYCKIEDFDIEIMHYEPTCWGGPPICFQILLQSNRIPKDYNMSYFKMIGFGAESMTNKFAKNVQKFLDKHNCMSQFSTSYGQSEGGTGFTTTFGKEMVLSGSYGIPYIDTILSIFEPKTANELKYYEIGEICKRGPGIMLGYSDERLTNEVIKKHPDGNIWLHTGDYGYMTEDGLLFVLGREGINVYPNKKIFGLNIENRISLIEGVKEAVVVSGTDFEHSGYEVPYLFVVLEDSFSKDRFDSLKTQIRTVLFEEEQPKDIFLIDKKPISHFKTDRKFLQKEFNLI